MIKPLNTDCDPDLGQKNLNSDKTHHLSTVNICKKFNYTCFRSFSVIEKKKTRPLTSDCGLDLKCGNQCLVHDISTLLYLSVQFMKFAILLF